VNDSANLSQPPPATTHPKRVRILLTIVGLVVLVGSLVAIKATQIGGLIKMGKAMEKAGPPPENVGSALAEQQSWGGTISAVGSITAAKGVSVSNEVPGTVFRISFESGKVAQQGQILVELDSSVERAQLASAQVRKDLATTNVNRSRALAKSNNIAQAQLDADESALKGAESDIATLNAQMEKKRIRAPFAGRLGIRAVNIGQYLNPGTSITTLEATDMVYVDFTVPQQQADTMKAGMPVKVTVEGAKEPLQGTVDAVDPAIDATTRAIKVRATVPNKEEKLRPGMFANVSVILPETGSVVIVPATGVIHASYGDSVFIVEDKKDESGNAVTGADGKPAKVARQQFVRVGAARGDFVAIREGVAAGQEIITAGAFKLRNGSGVNINNSVMPKPQLSPTPENR